MYAWEITNTADLEICTDALRAELAEWDAKLEASGVEDATAWEHFPEMEEVMYALAEFEHELAKRKDFESRYPREQYELDRAKAIAEGTDPRCIMSYQECFAHDCWEREMEREQEIWDAYDEAYEQMAIAAEVAERDSIIEQAELAWETSMAELKEFGCIEFEPQFNWHAKSSPEERGWSRAVLDIIAELGASTAESVFELF